MTVSENRDEKEHGGRKGAPTLDLVLSRDAFSTGRRMSGVVVLRLPKPAHIRALSVSVQGREVPTGAGLSGALRGGSSFFDRELLLSGKEQPRLTSERISQSWNAFLGRDTGRELTSGEHIYPFSIPLPASLPPSYRGRAGKIEYTASARLQFATGRALKIARAARITSVPRAARAQPIALSYPTAGGNIQTAALSVNLELPDRAVQLGDRITGHFTVSNPSRTRIGRVVVSLETCEWVRSAARKELQRQTLDQWTLEPDDPTSASIEAEFELNVPPDSAPTIEGTAISVIWLLKLKIDSDPPIELKTPITVCAPAAET